MKKIRFILLSLLLTLTLLLSACGESPLSSLLDDFDDKQNVEQQDDISSSSDTNAQSSKETEGQSHTSTPSTSESVRIRLTEFPLIRDLPTLLSTITFPPLLRRRSPHYLTSVTATWIPWDVAVW